MTSYTVRDDLHGALSSGHATIVDAEEHLQTEAFAAAVHPDRRAGHRLQLVITCDPSGTSPAGPVVAVHRWFDDPRA